MKEKFSFKKGHRARAIYLIFMFTFLTIMMICMILPIIKIVVDSVDPNATGMRLWPQTVDWSAYQYILSNNALYKPFLVSVGTTVIGTVVGLAVVTVSAYVLIQKEMPGRQFIQKAIMFTMLFNGGLIPTYLTVKAVGLMNNYIAVVVPLTLSAYNIILMRSFFDSLPEALFDAAKIDGCTPMGTFLKIVLPLSKPALASVGLFVAVSIWNDFFHFTIYINKADMQNFQVKLRELILLSGQTGSPTTSGFTDDMLKSAIILIAIVPFLCIYPFVQKYFVKGVTIGAVKG